MAGQPTLVPEPWLQQPKTQGAVVVPRRTHQPLIDDGTERYCDCCREGFNVGLFSWCTGRNLNNCLYSLFCPCSAYGEATGTGTQGATSWCCFTCLCGYPGAVYLNWQNRQSLVRGDNCNTALISWCCCVCDLAQQLDYVQH